jgi:hypothetical protein
MRAVPKKSFEYSQHLTPLVVGLRLTYMSPVAYRLAYAAA